MIGHEENQECCNNTATLCLMLTSQAVCTKRHNDLTRSLSAELVRLTSGGVQHWLRYNRAGLRFGTVSRAAEYL